MNRATLAASAIMALGIIQAGCVSLDQHKKVQLMLTESEADRQRLRAEVDKHNLTIQNYQDKEQSLQAQLADKDSRLAQMYKEVLDARDQVKQLTDQLAKAGGVVVTVSEGIKLPAAVHEALLKFAQKHPGLLDYDAKNGLVRFSSDLLFDLGSVEVKATEAKLLGDFAEVINIPAAQGFDVLVVGHTDNVRIVKPDTKARTPTNWHLSVYRAVAVLQVLEKHGVSGKRIGAMGFGEERPRLPNRAGGTKENRRVEVYLVPAGSLGSAAAAPMGGTEGAEEGAAPAKPAPARSGGATPLK